MIAVAYSGSAFQNTGPFRRIGLNKIVGGPFWTLLRYDLEQDCLGQRAGPVRNRRTYIEGHVVPGVFCKTDLEETARDVAMVLSENSVEPVKLTSKCVIVPNQVVLLVRLSMPYGGRAHVPLMRNPQYLEVTEKIEALESKDMRKTRSVLESLLGGGEAEVSTSAKGDTKRAKLLDWANKLRVSTGTHVSELERRVHVKSTDDGRTTCEYEDVEVPKTYKCFTCMTVAEHHHDACFLYEAKQAVEKAPMWGFSKFTSLEV